jgi:uncharacterized membrane protein
MPATFTKTRLEAFSDGVLAIIITIMVLELKVPHPSGESRASDTHGSFTELRPLLPIFLSYVLSFMYVGIYWNNHHHLLHATQRITGGILWANLHLLFWLSLIPFTTAWVGVNHFAPAPTAAYGAVLLMCGVAYTILQACILRVHGTGSALARAMGRDFKGKVSVLAYVAAVACSFLQPLVSQTLYVAVALLWLIPDRRVERALAAEHV